MVARNHLKAHINFDVSGSSEEGSGMYDSVFIIHETLNDYATGDNELRLLVQCHSS